MNDTVLPPVARPNYFTGEALLTDDFICEQAFQSGSLAAMNGTLHTYGVAAGLEVQWFKDTQPRQVHVSAGMAIDRLGRQVVLAEPQLIVLDGVDAGTTYYLTITYGEIYGGLTDESGVLGYKRVIQQPRISYERTLRDPGLNILLAVLTFTDQATIAGLTYRAGRDQRRYVGGRFGALSLVTEGMGIATGTVPGPTDVTPPATEVQLVARRETDGSGNSFLDIMAPRSQFAGPLTTRTAMGVGLDHPTAGLDVTTITMKGRGTFTTNGDLLTLTDAIMPPLQPGDLFAPDVSAALPQPQPLRVTIMQALSGGRQYKISRAFDPDITSPTRFTYIRTTLVRVADPNRGNLLSIGSDGTLWLGVRAPAMPGSTVPGPGALSITADRCVGIGLNGSAVPQAALQVAGSILTDQLISNGAVKAQSFEGNGSKLTNLSFLSYWTKTNVADNNSPIYYNQGNVGVQMTQPPGSLSAGTRAPFIGSGLISTDPAKPDTVKGCQTLFTSEIALGDSITVGRLDAQRRTVAKIIDDTTLIVDTQFSVILQRSSYQTATGQAQPQPGPGTISSEGTTIIGTGTRFTTLKNGDVLEIEAFTPFTDQKATRLVIAVSNDKELTLQPLDKGQTWEANLSAFMVFSGLMGYFQANEGKALGPALPVPALLVKNNGENPSGALAPNTVAINLPLEKTDPAFALQVDGKVNFSGSSTFTDLTTDTLTVNKWAKVSGDGSADALMTVGEAGSPALLTVTKTNVQLGTVAAGGPLLNVGGDVTATGTVTGLAVTATAAVTGATVGSTGDMNCGGLFTSKSLSIQGVTIGTDKSVALFGGRTAYGSSNLSNNSFSKLAATDGLVVIFLGTVSSDLSVQFASSLTVTTSLNAVTTSTTATAASTREEKFKQGKKGEVTIYIPSYGTMTVPVRKGEIWTLTKLDPPSGAGLPGANLVFYWVPLGPGATTTSLRSALPVPEGTEPAFLSLLSALQAQQTHVTSGGAMGVTDPASIATAQADIEARVGDLTRILGNATGMDAASDARGTFQRDLMAIVCRADAAPADGGPAPEAAIQSLVDTFAALTGHDFAAGQRELLAAGVRALVQINETPQNRQNLELIRTNIGIFLDNVQTALQRTFDARQRRLLTRALVRLVGDGSRTLPD